MPSHSTVPRPSSPLTLPQRDSGHIPVEIVDVETTGYVLRLCPFEDVAMVGLAMEDVEAFLQCVEEKCAILNATVTQREKFMELIELEPSVQVGRSSCRWHGSINDGKQSFL